MRADARLCFHKIKDEEGKEKEGKEKRSGAKRKKPDEEEEDEDGGAEGDRCDWRVFCVSVQLGS